MELDDFKNTWTQHNEKLNQQLEFNEKILRNMNLNNSKNEMKTPYNYEIFSIVTFLLVLLFYLARTFAYASQPYFLASGLVTSTLLAAGLILSFQKLQLLLRIDYHNMPVLELQKNINLFRQKYHVYKKAELFITPVLVVAMLPILAHTLHHQNLFANPSFFALIAGTGIVVSYPILFFIYKNWYDKKLNNTTAFLQELRDYELEN